MGILCIASYGRYRVYSVSIVGSKDLNVYLQCNHCDCNMLTLFPPHATK